MLDELETTLIMMKDYGIDNVRGACFSNVILSTGDKYIIKKMIADMYDFCYICHQEGHFARNCILKHNQSPEPKEVKVMTFDEQIYANLMKELEKN